MKSMLVIRGIVNLTLDPEKVPLPYGNKPALEAAINDHLTDVGSIKLEQISTVTRSRLSEDVLKTWDFDEPLDDGGVKIKKRKIRVLDKDDGKAELTLKDGDKIIPVGTIENKDIALAIGTAWQLGDLRL